MKRFLLIALVALTLYWILIFLFQRALLFPGAGYTVPDRRPQDAEQLWLSIPAGRVEAWYLPPLDEHAGAAPVMLFAHGNGEVIDLLPDHFREARRWGFAVLLVEYPGYGRSAGAPSRASIADVFEQAHAWVIAEPRIDSTRIVYYGQSLGTGAVSDLSRQHPPAALILQSGFTRISDFAWRLLAPPFLVRDRFDNVAAVQAYRGPRLILHGDHDATIPARTASDSLPRRVYRWSCSSADTMIVNPGRRSGPS